MGEDAIIAALNDPRRRQILKHVAEKGEPVSPGEVSRELRRGLSQVSYHVRVLRDAGALLLVDQQPVRGSVKRLYLPNEAVTGRGWVREILGLPPVESQGP